MNPPAADTMMKMWSIKGVLTVKKINEKKNERFLLLLLLKLCLIYLNITCNYLNSGVKMLNITQSYETFKDLYPALPNAWGKSLSLS